MNRYQQRDDVLRKMGYESYAAYLKSPLWARIRRRLFKVCDKCPCGQPATEVHHMSYKRRYLEGRGKIHKFLVPICRACHQRIEFDAGGKTPLGQANAVLDKIRKEAEAKGIRVPQKPRRQTPKMNAEAKAKRLAAKQNKQEIRADRATAGG